jgi:hypothetical protein
MRLYLRLLVSQFHHYSLNCGVREGSSVIVVASALADDVVRQQQLVLQNVTLSPSQFKRKNHSFPNFCPERKTP